MASALASNCLPALEELNIFIDGGPISALLEGLKGGASPLLKKLHLSDNPKKAHLVCIS